MKLLVGNSNPISFAVPQQDWIVSQFCLPSFVVFTRVSDQIYLFYILSSMLILELLMISSDALDIDVWNRCGLMDYFGWSFLKHE